MAVVENVENTELLQSEPEEWISTYTALTASGILERLGVKLPERELPYQLHDSHSFYRRLVRIPALNAFNELVRVQCRDIQSFSQQKIIDYLFSGEADKPDDAPGAAVRQKIENDRLDLVETGKKLTELEARHTQNIENTNHYLQQEVAHWHSLVDELTEKTWQLLQQHGMQLQPKFKSRLRDLFDLQGAGAPISSEVLEALQLKKTPSSWVKALIKLLVEVNSEHDTREED